MSEQQAVIVRIAEVSTAVGWQAGVPATDIAGMIVSFLAANPEHLSRFMDEGSELFVDGTIRTEHGSLTYRSMGGEILSPADLRQRTGSHDH